MNTQQAKLLIETGAITGATIYVMARGEIEIWFDGNVPPNTGNVLVATRGHARQPKTIDAAIRTIHLLGWKQPIMVDVSRYEALHKGAK